MDYGNYFQFVLTLIFIIGLILLVAYFAKKLCIENKISYAIFVQNGYCLNSNSDHKTLDLVYKKAKFILSVSKDITKCVKLAFPYCSNKIIESSFAINSQNFNLNRKRSNLITYMPRKLPQHSELVLFFLRKHLPKSWKIKKIHNFSEKKVFHYRFGTGCIVYNDDESIEDVVLVQFDSGFRKKVFIHDLEGS